METTEEIWKDIPGYEGLYQVSDLGRLKSLERKIYYGDGRVRISKEIVLSARSSVGYKRISIGYKKERKDFQVHSLVARTFIPNIGNYNEVNHKNGDKSDNRVSNLEWCTRSENCLHKFNVLGYRPTSISKIVAQISKDGFLLNSFNSLAEAGKNTGLNYRRIGECVSGERDSYGGFLWR